MSALIKSLQQHAFERSEAVVIETFSRTITWSEFDREVNALARDLTTCSNLGLMLENSPAWVIADLAAIKDEICNIPLPTFFSDQQIQHAIKDANIDHIITDQVERLLSLLNIKESKLIKIDDKEYHLLKLEPQVRKNNVDTAKVTYTSGTTGTPKGVRLSLQQIEKVAQNLTQAAQANSKDRALVLLPLSTLLENIGSVYAPIFVGARILLPTKEELGLQGSSQINAEQLVIALQHLKPSTLIVPPQLLKLLIIFARQKILPDSFRYIAVGGAPVGNALLKEAAELELPVYQGYGLSEACSVISTNTPDQNRHGSVGKPLPHQKVRIAEGGEIIIHGETFSGYLNEQKRDPQTELATGDVGYLNDEGYLYVTGRKNQRIISSYGRNVSPEWIESELESHDAIMQAAVLGNNKPFLIAVIVSKEVNKLDHAIESINKTLPDYAQIKNYIVAQLPFTISNLQCTTNGKPRRDQIKQEYREQIENIYESVNRNVL
ncbi:MAG: AMP-binding protein [Gammaproteobacteria bacterium]